MKFIPTLMVPLLLLAAVCIDGYKPVVIVHGLFGGPHFETLISYITKVHPGTKVSVIDLYNELASLMPLWMQVQGFRKAIDPIMQNAPDGIHLLCFSQGGLICRALLTTTPDHNVHTFIAVSSPLAGQYGVPDQISWFTEEIVSRLCYSILADVVSVCQFWKDPHHRSLYLRRNNFLAKLNGEKPHQDMKAWRENFLRIKKLVLTGGPDDGIVTPWQSSHFGFYDSDENVVEMRNQEYYRNDTFGLKTLDTRGDVSTCIRSNLSHLEWITDYNAFKSCIKQWLI